MKILMMTNTYLPHVGGVARSVSTFAEALRGRGHDVLVVAPRFEDTPTEEAGVIRLPAIQRFNGSDFSVRLPIPGLLFATLEHFHPQVVHAHHPFLLGDTALRTAVRRELPLLFTHHTMYEQYTHYVPGDSRAMQQFVASLATEYANLCDHVIAPSESIEQVLRERGVVAPITAIPTGIDPAQFAHGDGSAARARWGIPDNAFVVGHVGRLAPEKNLAFLAQAAAAFLDRRADAWFMAVGAGPSREQIEAIFAERGQSGRVRLTGSLQGQALADAYHAMDAFAFASQTETQGMVLAEALTAGVPVVAVDAPGVREIVVEGCNGRLLNHEDTAQFAAALQWVADRPPAARRSLADAARASAQAFSIGRCVDRLAGVYEGLASAGPTGPGGPGSPGGGRRLGRRVVEHSPWTQALRLVEAEWNLWNGRTDAALRSLRRQGRKTASGEG